MHTVVGIPTGSRAIYVSYTFFYATSSSPRPSQLNLSLSFAARFAVDV